MNALTETIVLDLTGPGSHRLKREPGKGNLSIGPKSAGRKPDLIVAPDDVINWHVFDTMRTGAGSNWPRHIAYEGNDTSLFDWMRQRDTEQITVRPHAPLDIDMSACKLGTLVFELTEHRLRLTLPKGLNHLSLRGDPALVAFAEPPDFDAMQLALTDVDGFVLQSLADLPEFSAVRHLSVSRKVMGDDGFDCASLRNFQSLRSLSLYGAARNLDALSQLPLTSLQLRFVPDLAGLPELSTWPLSGFIAWNVEEVRGKQLKAELAKRQALEGDGYFSVSQLRSRAWFTEEYGLPFAAWPKKSEKAASTAYKAAARLLRKARDADTAKAAITAFVAAINDLPDIETSEREDAGHAVALLAAIRPDLATPEQAQAWFDDVRDF